MPFPPGLLSPLPRTSEPPASVCGLDGAPFSWGFRFLIGKGETVTVPSPRPAGRLRRSQVCTRPAHSWTPWSRVGRSREPSFLWLRSAWRGRVCCLKAHPRTPHRQCACLGTGRGNAGAKVWREGPGQSETRQPSRRLGAQDRPVGGAEAGSGAMPVHRTPCARSGDTAWPLHGRGECGEVAEVHQETHPPSPIVCC